VIRIHPEITGRLQPGDVDAVRASLQAAIELEHATIPPYLYALYSLEPGTNSAAANIIESIVIEEMLHLTLAANILNALGGSPVLDSPTFIPHYPGPLPGSVENELVVGLAPCSLDLVKNTFMAIEEPEYPLEFSAEAIAAGQPLTIGQFYRAIRATIVKLGDNAFTRHPRNQITPGQMKEAVVVTDVATACQAIDTITDQGEGTTKSPLEIIGPDYGHYYRFAEIANGRRLIPNPNARPDAPPDQQYVYGGELIALDPAGILPVPTDPTIATYPEGSPARNACITFNYTYTNLLKSLHTTLNGKPDNLDASIGLMMSLRQQAIGMMTGTTTAATATGPTFEWQPTNEAPETSGVGMAAAGRHPPAGVGEAAAPDAAAGSASSGAVPAAPPASTQPSAPSRAPSGGVVPAGDCGCGGGAKKSYIFAIGAIGTDFGTLAGRDAFRQLMPRHRIGDTRPPVMAPPNPYDVNQLANYLDDHKSESTNLIWTLNLDATPIYAIEAELAYAEDVYEVLRSALRNQALPTDDENYVSRVSIPGVRTNRTRRLFSGQVVPVVIAQPRGLYTWNESALVNVVVDGVQQAQPDIREDILRLTIRNFLDKIYYQLRNLGQTSSDRALNYAATNAFIAGEVITQGLLTSQNIPTASPEKPIYSLDAITVQKSPYCRMDSDCWDVQVTFFNPDNILNARSVYQFTLDVSDELPVTLAPVHHFFTT